ncbi:MAG: [protein-PII] uridylyltransferase, partial [Marinovum sp.]|nr:[protein-PII] uridylyltransferase [Marinovum sp.]
MICDPDQIFDIQAAGEILAEAVETAKTSKSLRERMVKDLRARQKFGMAEIAKAFEKTPAAAHQMTRSQTYLTDCLVHTVWKIATHWLHPLPNPTEGERLSVIAVGGYGRGEMAPYSDVDLLFLTPYKLTPWAESVIESMLYMLWDLKLKIGHAS